MLWTAYDFVKITSGPLDQRIFGGGAACGQVRSMSGLPGGTEYTSNHQKCPDLLRFSYKNGAGYYEDGMRYNCHWRTSAYRYQPYVRLRWRQITIRSNCENLGATTRILAGRPRIGRHDDQYAFLTTFIQFTNERSKNINLNARFPMRFNQVADLFLYYTD